MSTGHTTMLRVVEIGHDRSHSWDISHLQSFVLRPIPVD